jgi:formylglycine-generating enzyme required for sulfatase activity
MRILEILATSARLDDDDARLSAAGAIMGTRHSRVSKASWRSLLGGSLQGPIAATAIVFAILGTEIPFGALGADVSPLLPDQETALKPGQVFRECTDCPEMVVVPAGSFVMGSPPTEKNRLPNEGPHHDVTIAKSFAVSKYELTFADWDTCTSAGACKKYEQSDSSWGRGRQPAINVSWEDAQQYAAWLSKTTGKSYRLLTEAEYEYAARAGTQTPYPWGLDVGKQNANCMGCGESNPEKPSPVGSFPPNKFGLYDMVGNVWAWVEDCDHENYDGAPKDGSAWIKGGDCDVHMVRGGSWFSTPQSIRSATRSRDAIGNRSDVLGIRVARNLNR